jgi:hypothetical protein
MPKNKLPQVVSRRVKTFISNTAWGEFVDWCLLRNLKPMPVHAWTLASHVLSLEGQLGPIQIRKCLIEVAKIHTAKTIKIFEKRNN